MEKIVRYVEENSGGSNSWTHGHHHHNHNSKKKLDDSNSNVKLQSESFNAKGESVLNEAEAKESDQASHEILKGDNPAQPESLLRKVR